MRPLPTTLDVSDLFLRPETRFQAFLLKATVAALFGRKKCSSATAMALLRKHKTLLCYVHGPI